MCASKVSNNFRRDLDCAQYGFDLIENGAFGNEDLLARRGRITANEIDVPTLL
jgi:hypothetical protein